MNIVFGYLGLAFTAAAFAGFIAGPGPNQRVIAFAVLILLVAIGAAFWTGRATKR